MLTGNSKIWMLDSAGKTQWQKDLAVTVRACDDIDNSDTQTIIASSDNIFYAIHADDGKIRWQNDMFKCISSTPVIIDLDNNGRKEIVCASSITFQSPNEY